MFPTHSSLFLYLLQTKPNHDYQVRRYMAPIRQLVTGPLTATPSDLPCATAGVAGGYLTEVQLAGAGLGGAAPPVSAAQLRAAPFAYVHAPLAPERSFAAVAISTFSGALLHRGTGLVREHRPTVRGLVGPVVGRVGAHDAVVLLEVDQAAAVTLVLTDSVSQDKHRVLRDMAPRRPTPFVLSQLQAGHHYSLVFEGIADAAERVGSFTTVGGGPAGPGAAKAGVSLSMLVVSADNPTPGGGGAGVGIAADRGEEDDGMIAPLSLVADGRLPEEGGGGGDSGGELWQHVRQLSETPWGGVDLVLHLGGQVSFEGSASCQAVKVLLQRCERPHMPRAERAALEEEALELLREAYRVHWNLPGTREALAHGQHIMLGGAADRTDGAEGAGPAAASMRRLLRAVYREYQRQLWDPECDVSPAPPPRFVVGGVAGGGGGGGGGGGDDDDDDGGAAQMAGLSDESQYHQWGGVGLLALDVRGNRFGADGEARSAASLLAPAQWAILDRVLSSGGGGGGGGGGGSGGGGGGGGAGAAAAPDAAAKVPLRTIIVAAECAFVDDSPADARVKVCFHSSLAPLARSLATN